MSSRLSPASAFMTEDEVSDRYRGLVAPGTLRNWRNRGVGPPYVKVGKGVLYARAGLEAWEAKNTMSCDLPPERPDTPEPAQRAAVEVDP